MMHMKDKSEMNKLPAGKPHLNEVKLGHIKPYDKSISSIGEFMPTA